MPNLTINYTQDIDTVYRFVTDPEVIKKRSEAMGEMNIKIQIDEAGGTKTITSTREIESDLPGFAKRLFSSTNTIVERREWRDAGDKKTCKAHIDILGTPRHDRLQHHDLPEWKWVHLRHRVRSDRKGSADPQEARGVRRQDDRRGHA